MGCVQPEFCKFSSLFLGPPSAGQGKRLSGTGGRVKTFEQHSGSMKHLTDVQVLQLLLLTCTMLVSPVKPHAHTGCLCALTCSSCSLKSFQKAEFMF